MKSTLIVAGLIGFASAGGFALAAPASANCSPSFTSIPCTIAESVSSAPATTAGALLDTPNQLASGIQSTTQIAGVGCPPDDDGNDVPCGLPAVPGQFSDFVNNLPNNALAGATQIATAPIAIAGGLLNAPGQFAAAIQNGGTAPAAP